VKCNICGSEAVLKPGDEIHHSSTYAKKKFWYCDNGHEAAWVGTNPKTNRPLGTLADSQTRQWRSFAHQAFDPIWKENKLTRSQAYAILAKMMGLSTDECHIGNFDIQSCRHAICCTKQLTQILGGNINE
jgi:hypothetical protein